MEFVIKDISNEIKKKYMDEKKITAQIYNLDAIEVFEFSDFIVMLQDISGNLEIDEKIPEELSIQEYFEEKKIKISYLLPKFIFDGVFKHETLDIIRYDGKYYIIADYNKDAQIKLYT